LLFQTAHLSLIHGQAAWYAEVSSEIEQVVLYIFQPAAQNFVEILCKQYTDIAIQFIHGTHGLYAQAFFSAPAAISQSRGAIVSCTGVDSGKTISHSRILMDGKTAWRIVCNTASPLHILFGFASSGRHE
jgi:hypothetical protein